MSSEVDLRTVPAMSPTFRLQWEEAQQSYVILYPEGMVKLSQSAGEILSRCDGERDIAAIIADLEQQFPDADGLATDVLNFLSTAYDQQWIQDKRA